MKAIHSMIAALGLAFVLPGAADAGVNDSEVIIYRFPGVLDFAFGLDTPQGVATVFHCTNFSGVPEKLRFVTRRKDTELRGNSTINIAHLATITAVTHLNNAYVSDLDLSALDVTQGTTAIAATSINIICTAMTIDANGGKPVGVALRGIRFNPIPGSQE